MSIEDPFERFFYEFESIKGTWSVRELRRQIATNLYVRAGISKKPELLLDQLVNNDFNAIFNVREPMSLEFLGLDAKESITESDLEQRAVTISCDCPSFLYIRHTFDASVLCTMLHCDYKARR